MPTLATAPSGRQDVLPQGLRRSTVVHAGCPATERPELLRQLAALNISVVWADASPELLETARRRSLPVVLDLGSGSGLLHAATDLRTQSPATLVFAAVSPTRPDLAREAVLTGCADVFMRPLNVELLAETIRREAGSGAPADDVKASEYRGGQLYCLSPAMCETVAAVAAVAPVAWTGVVVRGETGSGRRAVGRAVHAADKQARSQRFVAVDCGAFDPHDLEAELFGAVAQDGARGPECVSRSSRVFEARGGTLYLEHVSEAASRVQARLARLLRDREAVVSETGQTTPFVLRPIAAIESGFEAAVEDGRVRDELYRRLAGMHVSVPPLRQRREDIPLLANYFVRRACAARRIPPKVLTRGALSLLGALQWRGNAGELKGLLETIVTGGRGSLIALEDVLTYVRLDGGAMIFADSGTLRQARARFESEYIAAVLRRHRGRVTEASKALGIQRPNLYRKMRALKVTRTGRA
jgi:DNA-binding NtrC family response regulator